MCGILGVASSTPISSREWLADGCAALAHRGPDHTALWWSEDQCVGFGHRRLAIIDLSPSGNQPMVDDSQRFVIVFNGEIYNHAELRSELLSLGFHFRSSSDTEVLLNAYRAWGAEVVSHLDGMFAFSIFDRERRTVYLARDRAGEKPLFYVRRGGELRFASELKGLLADGALDRSVDLDGLASLLYFGYVPGDRCILKGFNKLPPAHAMEYALESGVLRVWRYWQLPEVEDCRGPASNESDLLDELDYLLERSVRKQLVADVPVGILLSGGLDSSLVTAMAARARPDIKTFTIRFPGEGRHDETEHARLIARHFGTDHVELEATPDATRLLPLLAKQFDEPIVDSSLLPTYMVCQLVRSRAKVALGGDGGDELFGGYGYYSKLLQFQRGLAVMPMALRKLGASVAQRFLPLGFGGNNIRNWLVGLDKDLSRELPLIGMYFDQDARSRLFAKRVMVPSQARELDSIYSGIEGDILQRATRLDFQSYLAEDILVKIDRASMLNSLELRAPMLDRQVIEFAYRKVPSQLKATIDNKKVLLKRLAQRVLPEEFDRQRKQGFSIPLGNWLSIGPVRDLFNQVLLAEDTIFDKAYVSNLLRGQNQGRSNEERLFGLVMFELWRREYKVSL